LWFTDWRGWTTSSVVTTGAEAAISPTSFLTSWFPTTSTGTGTGTGTGTSTPTNEHSVGFPSTARLITAIALIATGFAGVGVVLFYVSKSRHAYNVWRYQQISQRERAILAVTGGVADLPPDATASAAIKNVGLSVASFGSSSLGASPSTTLPY
jgi:hypothetical protein